MRLAHSLVRLALITALSVGGLLVARPSARAQTAPATPADQSYRHRVLGVFDELSGEAIEDAEVTDVLAGLTAKTSSSGAVSLAFLPDGGGMIRIRKFGYEQVTMFVPISPADTAPVTIILSRVTTLAPIETRDSSLFRSARLQGFAERLRTAHAGHFVGPDELRKEGDRPLGDVLIHRVPGIIITAGPHSGYMLQRSAHCARGSAPDVYLDGVPITHPRPGAPIDLSEFQTSNLAGIEYYATASLAPPQFSGTSLACGVLVLWTRER
jgi:hypothetical protein